MGRTTGSKNRPIEERLRLEVDRLKKELKDLKEEHLKDMRIIWKKIQDRRNCSLIQAEEIGKIKRQMKTMHV